MTNCFRFCLLLAGCIACFSGCSSAKKIVVYKETADEIVFKNYQDEIITHQIKKDVAKCQYNKSQFKIKKDLLVYDKDPNYKVRLGVDISRHDGSPIDWKAVKKSGRDFVFLRVAYRGYQSGILKVDEHFHENITGALAEGMDVGVYVFSQAINEQEALEEAEFVLEQIKDYAINLPVVFDPESIPWEEARTDDVSGEQFTKNTIVFCERMKQAGYEPMIYSNITWEAKFFDLSLLKDYKIWFADYQVPPTSPYHFEYFQYGGESAKIPGVPNRCDVDAMLVPVGKERP
ncbi:MAG: glycoside hydrolase family 25 protein [Treponema sp.]|nr:glycoside hydrolase family 25 protein [Treponema sp.]